ncbi:pilus assembly protein [Methylobacterium durans]|uniref:TadE/TadG family type IV pilus assembly protein n=1 Tax=Methylobacterium durans TaxID=2202825 RepID=UPI002AFE7AF8|nr:pilus assembly protein [Methylobacterium durans]MEA1831187.1 pilus assembly protein [Methylobacterium durans]
MPLRHPRFRTDQRGNIAIMFGLSLLPVLALSGAAIDYSQATTLRARLQAATDATALRLCQLPRTTSAADIKTKALAWMKSYMGNDLVTMPAADFKVTDDPRQIEMKSLMASPTYFGKIYKMLGSGPSLDGIPVGASARCAAPVPQDFEIALVVDTTGSMDGTDKKGVSKIVSLRKAAKDFVDFVADNPAFSAQTRIALVPFASSVAVDPTTITNAVWLDKDAKSPIHWNNFESDKAYFNNRFEIFDSLKNKYTDWKWSGCFESLPYPLNATDSGFDPARNESYYVPLLAPDEPGDGSTGSVTTKYKSGSITRQTSSNSYLDDSTSKSYCKPDPDDAISAEKRACKYANPTGAASRPASGLNVANGPNYGCTSQPLTRLTTDFTGLKAKIDTLYSRGATNIQEGLIWGWRTLSPVSVFGDGVAYAKPNSRKVLILMTDGENTWNPTSQSNSINKSVYSSFGYYVNADGSKAADYGKPTNRFPEATANPVDADDARAAMDKLTSTTCANIANMSTPIEVFTIGFSVDNDKIDQKGIDLLAGCASKPTTNHAFVANDSAALLAVFRQIATSIGALRLTQ